jgi:hypothetical protein
MDLKEAENHIDTADRFLDKLWKFLGKHWGKLIILLLLFGSYKFITFLFEDLEATPQTEQVQEISPEIINQEYFLVGSDTMIVRTWSDNIQDTIYRSADN